MAVKGQIKNGSAQVYRGFYIKFSVAFILIQKKTTFTANLKNN
jgi:hypothetical protein